MRIFRFIKIFITTIFAYDPLTPFHIKDVPLYWGESWKESKDGI